MPAVLVEACRRHHDTLEQLQELPDQRAATLMRYVRIATSTGDFLTRNGDVEVRQELEELAKIFLGCRVRELDDLLDEARDSTDDAASLMSIDTAQLPRPAEMLSRANAQLAEIAIRARAEQTRASEATQQLADQKEELQRQNNRLQEASETDGLTGLFNRRAFDHRYEETISRCINTGQSAGVIFTDIDNFKQINDNYGHPFGDAVLQRIGKILLEAVRQSDFVARYGGEEFVIVAANCPPHVVDIIAERIRSKVDAETFACDDRPVHVTVSVGGSVLSVPTDDVPRHPSIAQSMLKQADQAMYDCKRSGRNRVKICKCDEPSELTA